MRTEVAGLIWLLGSWLLCTLGAACLSPLCRRHRALPWLAMLLGLLEALVLSRLVYYVSQLDYMLAEGWLRALVSADAARWSFWGGSLGACLGTALAARMLNIPAMTALDALTPFLDALAALLRAGCWLMQDSMAGLGRSVEAAVPLFTLVNRWGERYLAVFALESLAAAVCLCLSLRMKTRRFLRAALLLSLAETFLCLLRNDSYYLLFFLNVEHILHALTALCILIFAAVRRFSGRPWRPVWISAGCLAVVAAAEYVLDKNETLLSRFFPAYAQRAAELMELEGTDPTAWISWVCYGVMLAALITMAVVGDKALRGSRES